MDGVRLSWPGGVEGPSDVEGRSGTGFTNQREPRLWDR
jgi:hypothetical protein